MAYLVIKTLVSAVIIVAISELSRRSSLAGALLASLPLVSVLGMIWLYIDTRDAAAVSALSTGVFWLVLPSLGLFLSLPVLLKHGVGFLPALGLSAALTICLYFLMLKLLKLAGITI